MRPLKHADVVTDVPQVEHLGAHASALQPPSFALHTALV